MWTDAHIRLRNGVVSPLPDSLRVFPCRLYVTCVVTFLCGQVDGWQRNIHPTYHARTVWTIVLSILKISLSVSPSGSRHSAEKSRCLSQSVCRTHSPLPEPFLHSLWRGLYVFFLYSQLLTWNRSDPDLINFSPTETCKHISPHTADWNNPVHFGSQGEFLRCSLQYSTSHTDHMLNFVMLRAAVLHSRAGGRHSRWTQSAETCSGKRTHYPQSEPRRSTSRATASRRGT